MGILAVIGFPLTPVMVVDSWRICGNVFHIRIIVLTAAGGIFFIPADSAYTILKSMLFRRTCFIAASDLACTCMGIPAGIGFPISPHMVMVEDNRWIPCSFSFRRRCGSEIF